MIGLSTESAQTYAAIRGGAPAFREIGRGLVAVWGGEAVRFLNGLVTNDVAKLGDGQQVCAAFPNAQGRLLAVVRIRREGERFLFDTEEATAKKVFDILFKFTFAGDFFVEDLSPGFRYFEVFNLDRSTSAGRPASAGGTGSGVFVDSSDCDGFIASMRSAGAVEAGEDVYELLRIEKGVPAYGVDVDESTVVPELGSEGLISYDKGCYIGQEVVARIHFRGHVAKELRIVEFEGGRADVGDELVSAEGKSAGRLTSVALSPDSGDALGLALVRYEFIGEGTELFAGGVRGVVRKPVARTAAADLLRTEKG